MALSVELDVDPFVELVELFLKLVGLVAGLVSELAAELVGLLVELAVELGADLIAELVAELVELFAAVSVSVGLAVVPDGEGDAVVIGLGFVRVFGDACVVDCTEGAVFWSDCGAELCCTGCGWASKAWQKLTNWANLGSRYVLVVAFVWPLFATMQALQSEYDWLKGEPAAQRAGDLPTASASR